MPTGIDLNINIGSRGSLPSAPTPMSVSNLGMTPPPSPSASAGGSIVSGGFNLAMGAGALAIVGISAGVAVAVKLLTVIDESIRAMADKIQKWSPEIMMANAENLLIELETQRRQAAIVGTEIAEYLVLTKRIESHIEIIKANLLKKILPFINWIMVQFEKLMLGVEIITSPEKLSMLLEFFFLRIALIFAELFNIQVEAIKEAMRALWTEITSQEDGARANALVEQFQNFLDMGAQELGLVGR